MKFLTPLLLLIVSSCSYYNVNSEQKTQFIQSEKASHLVQRVQAHDYKKWKLDIERIKDTYARVIKILDDRQSIQFTVAFFKVLSLDEELDNRCWNLSHRKNDLPNTDTLKFLYHSEKAIDEMMAIVSPFTESPNVEIQHCATETEKYLEYKKDLLAAIRDVNYLDLEASVVPSEVLRANARFLEQRDQMTQSLIVFYADLADVRLGKQ